MSRKGRTAERAAWAGGGCAGGAIVFSVVIPKAGDSKLNAFHLVWVAYRSDSFGAWAQDWH
ncbi:MAG: hypothetical protein P8010_06095 [Desulfosarcinaceae bacterium]|jgi:hypothetical protein